LFTDSGETRIEVGAQQAETETYLRRNDPMTLLNPYISFKDNAREAMEFYRSVFGGELTMSTFQEYGLAQDPSDANKLMHSQLKADNGIVFMGADTPSTMMSQWDQQTGSRITMSLSGTNDAELRGYWDKLSAGGTIVQPLELAPWGDAFGMLTDKYGIEWMVNIAGTQP